MGCGAATSVRRLAEASIDHLVDATGVHRGSLYGVFGSKRGLFLRVGRVEQGA
ncbi:TetR family transcriptional regulator [Mycolicibacterium mengxianglii]|uniref:TetR family transcriptional regulator n=1 Tax=Mycolicibacterium mengxianglii TaxID=2736649 RepID=UPI0018D18973|nr:TetR family transcriptional regulator [Mycolicibacterium mengxianglii]